MHSYLTGKSLAIAPKNKLAYKFDDVEEHQKLDIVNGRRIYKPFRVKRGLSVASMMELLELSQYQSSHAFAQSTDVRPFPVQITGICVQRVSEGRIHTQVPWCTNRFCLLVSQLLYA